VRADLAMTGEITLRGRVLEVGGIKEKLLAAHRGGVRRVVVPQANLKDVEEVASEIRSELEIIGSDEVMTNICEALLDETEAGSVGGVQSSAKVELRLDNADD
jgi:ATP-dependent Lon protease